MSVFGFRQGDEQDLASAILHSCQGRAEILTQALMLGRSRFVEELLDRSIGGNMDEFVEFVTIQRLYRLHEENVRNKLKGNNLRICLQNTTSIGSNLFNNSFSS